MRKNRAIMDTSTGARDFRASGSTATVRALSRRGFMHGEAEASVSAPSRRSTASGSSWAPTSRLVLAGWRFRRRSTAASVLRSPLA